MDGSRFDTVARALAGGGSRRSLMKAAFGAAVGGAVTVALSEETAAARKRVVGEVCRKNGDCASDVCGPKDRYGRKRCACEGPLVLAGSKTGGDVCVDDELTVYVNGTQVYQHLGGAACLGQLPLGPLAAGDQIEVVANNSDFYCGCESLTPLYLVCPSGGGAVALDTVGHPFDGNCEHPCGETFYDKTFTV